MRLTEENANFQRNWQIKEGQLKNQVTKLRDEKTGFEKQLVDTEFLHGEKDRELAKEKEAAEKMRADL